MENMNAIYRKGDLNITSFVNDEGIVLYSKGKTVGEYLAGVEDLKNILVIPFKKAMSLIQKEFDKMASEPWEEIDESVFTYALECLPPCRWQRENGVEFFQMSELYVDDITFTYAKRNGRCFKSRRQRPCAAHF